MSCFKRPHLDHVKYTFPSSTLSKIHLHHLRSRGSHIFERDNGCDYRHWLIQLKEDPVGSRDEIIDAYLKLVAQVLGSEEEARKKISSVSTKYYFAVGVLVSEDVAYKWKQLDDVMDVVPDLYVDPATQGYGGEPFVDGEAVPYDPKYHAHYHRVQARTKAIKSAP